MQLRIGGARRGELDAAEPGDRERAAGADVGTQVERRVLFDLEGPNQEEVGDLTLALPGHRPPGLLGLELGLRLGLSGLGLGLGGRRGARTDPGGGLDTRAPLRLGSRLGLGPFTGRLTLLGLLTC